MDSCYQVEKIAGGTWRICENGSVNAYVLAGKKQALVIDSGCGAGNFREAVTELTTLPVIAVSTHRHPDHVGAMKQFGVYYAGKDDLSLLYTIMCSKGFIRRMIPGKVAVYAAFAGPGKAKVLPLQKGQSFDLGNRKIDVVEVPGHTKGSIILVEKNKKLIFTGDALNPSMWMHLPGSTSIETWLNSTAVILDILGKGYTAWYGHGDGRLSEETAKKIADLGRELVEKKKSGTLHGGNCYPLDGTFPQILYAPYRILNK